MSEIIHIDNYRPSPTESYFFDNNVWMFIHYPIGNYAKDKQKKYSRLLQDILNLKCNIFINALLVSEFINACLRSDFRNWCDLPQNKGKHFRYKEDFVGSKDYQIAVQDVLSSIAQIRKVTIPGTDDFHYLNLDAILAGMTAMDFNDNYYLALAERKKWTLISDDSDLLGKTPFKVRIVSAKKP